VPAAAVIPAPIAYIKVVAVKKLVVGFWDRRDPVCHEMWCVPIALFFLPVCWALLLTEWSNGSGTFTLKKLECLKQAKRAI